MTAAGTRVADFRHSFSFVALVAALAYFVPYLIMRPQGADAFFSALVTISLWAAVAGLALGYVSRWWQLFAARYLEGFVSFFFSRDSFVLIGLGVAALSVFLLLLNYFNQGGIGEGGVGVAVLKVGVGLLILPVVLIALVVTLALWIVAWLGAQVALFGLFLGLIALVVGLLLGAFLYTAGEYLRIFFSRAPLQDVLASYGRLTTAQLAERIKLAVRKAGEFNSASLWELEKQTRISAELAAKLRADKEMIDAMISLARAENEHRFVEQYETPS